MIVRSAPPLTSCACQTPPIQRPFIVSWQLFDRKTGSGSGFLLEGCLYDSNCYINMILNIYIRKSSQRRHRAVVLSWASFPNFLVWQLWSCRFTGLQPRKYTIIWRHDYNCATLVSGLNNPLSAARFYSPCLPTTPHSQNIQPSFFKRLFTATLRANDFYTLPETNLSLDALSLATLLIMTRSQTIRPKQFSKPKWDGPGLVGVPLLRGTAKSPVMSNT